MHKHQDQLNYIATIIKNGDNIKQKPKQKKDIRYILPARVKTKAK